ncbi:hypothetical protein CAN33_0020510 [Aspergillus niger]|uniref:AMP-dependent synthetase/ligase domain-containing protein n=3 Tax=Aspergillus TaxID=5052 RepID=A0A370PU40_ASPPH|nr:hypothetical protein M747DRAFT_339990 [Aspergillus niger ATCC 13496]RDK45660.1 hypothetical protein M752DRAFT_290498 [Aspergillus phoenicis ATCC 13157]TPR06257.1 hypothetical protein CAN33_0020510 [Aspergillus niger]GJP88726.1 hypothetical protein AlacWU_01625 [Aspergillus niger]
MNQSATAAPWAQGAEKYRGKHCFPLAIDYFAHQEPERIFACIPISSDVADGFRNVTEQDMAAAVLAYIGPSDLRCAILLMAAIMCGTKILFMSPRNTLEQNNALLEIAKVDLVLY